MTFGSLFSGVGGFDLGFERNGMQCLWQVEIDKNCQRVLSRHWPNVEKFKDVKNVGKNNLRPVDIICGGFPCQDVSVAGKRAGLSGERSGLWFEFKRIISEMKPRFVVIENVPGLLSSNHGKDIQVILDNLNDLGYVIDIDILDAQYFGVAQRRRRVFIVCQLVEDLMNQKMISSGITIAQCLTENLLLVLTGARGLLNLNLENLAFANGKLEISLKQRMKLFGMQKEGAAQMLAESLDVLHRSLDSERENLEYHHGKNIMEDSKTSGATKLLVSTKKMEEVVGCQSIGLSWKDTLEECFPIMSECITSMDSSEITESKIYSCALLTLNIARLIIHLPPSCPTFWSAALSSLITLEAYIKYARQTSSDLFTESNWIQPWYDFIGQAMCVRKSFRNIGIGNFGKIFSISKGVSWDTPTRSKTGQGIAESFAASLRSGGNGKRGYTLDAEHGLTTVAFSAGNSGDSYGIGLGEEIAPPLRAGASGTNQVPTIARTLNAHGRRIDGESENFIVTKTLTANGDAHSGFKNEEGLVVATLNSSGNNGGFRTEPGEHIVAMPLLGKSNSSHDESLETYVATIQHASVGRKDEAGPQGKGWRDDGKAWTLDSRSTSDVVITFDERQITSKENRSNPQSGDPCHTLHSDPPRLVWNWQSGGDVRHSFSDKPMLQANQVPAVGVRRLTPRECERLQAFPDDFTRWDAEGKEIADSVRYKMLGNAVCVNVATWIGRQIMKNNESF